jgi:tetratricopeptide (TPR) repeat protein
MDGARALSRAGHAAVKARGLWLSLWCIVAAMPTVATTVKPCDPVTDCVLLLARENSFREVATAHDDPSLDVALRVLHWVFEQKVVTHPDLLRPQFSTLRLRLERWPTGSKPLHLSGLAMAMASARLVAEARSLSGTATDFHAALIDSAAVSYYARRGQLAEAFAAAKQPLAPELMSQGALHDIILESVASTGKPELVLETGRLGGFDAQQVGSQVARALQVAGQHDAARTAAAKLKDPTWRQSTIGLMALRYEQRGPKSEVVPAMRLWLAQLQDPKASSFMPEGRARETALKILRERLTEAGDFAGVLALIPRLQPNQRASAMTSIATRLRSIADIQNTALASEGLLRTDRELVADALNISRVRIGAMKAADAMKSSGRPRATSNFLIELARELRSTQPEKAREILQAAIAPDPRIVDPDWDVVIAAQLELGLFADATRTLDRHQRTPAERMVSQLRFSQAYARRGQADLAKRFREQALTNFHASGRLASEPAALASQWLSLGALDDAEAELKSLMARKVPADALRATADAVIEKRVERGELAPALAFAMNWSTHQGGRSKPFTDIYSGATGAIPPQ